MQKLNESEAADYGFPIKSIGALYSRFNKDLNIEFYSEITYKDAYIFTYV